MAKEDKSTEKSILAVTRDSLIIFAILLYFIGWTYQYTFFWILGLKLSVFEQPFHYVLVYSFSVIYKVIDSLMTGNEEIIIIGAIFLFTCYVAYEVQKKYYFAAIVIALILGMSIIFGAFHYAQISAAGDARVFLNDRSSFVAFDSKTWENIRVNSNDPIVDEMHRAQENNSLRYFWEDDDFIYVEYTFDSVVGTVVKTYRVKKENVSIFLTQRTLNE